jgi:HEAT repeat protein
LFVSLSAWPLPQAGPVLLAALEKPGYLTRRTAAAQLAARWPPAAEFPTEGPKQRRAEVAAALQNRFRQEFGFVDAAALAQTLAADRNRPTVTAETLDRLQELLRGLADPNAPEAQRAAARGALLDFGPELTTALERLAVDRKLPLPEAVYTEVLPKRDPSFADIQGLTSADLLQRQRAAESLAARGSQRPLTTLATLRLNTLLLKETDEQVWRNVLTAVAADPNAAAAQLAYAAIGHPAPEVRRRACQHLAAHPAAQHAKVLLPALDDANRSVVAAAVDALGRLGRLDDTEPLRRLTHGDDEPLRMAAAVALARLGDPLGRDAVQRMAYHSDPAVRRQAALVLGELEDMANVPTLLLLLDDRPAVCSAAMESLTRVAGRNVAEIEGQPPANTSQQIRRWKEWFDRQQAEAAGKQTAVSDRYGR